MKTGDIVTDSRAAAWTLGAPLGQGAWGRVWLVRHDDGRQRVLKAPYAPDDLPPASADRIPIMRACAAQQADALGGQPAHLAPLEDRITLPSGAIALLLPHYPTTLERQLASGLPLVQALDEIVAVCRLLHAARQPHGNLRPSNILIGASGQPALTDPLTPELATLLPGAARANPDRDQWVAPDGIANDTWALCAALYTAVMLDEPQRDSPTTAPPVPRAGLDKVALADVRARAAERLKRDGANPRFVHRTAERLATLLARGLSGRADPSPPYRFLTPGDLLPRLTEVAALVRPGIDSVGKLLLSRAAKGDVFDAPGPVGFTVAVAPTDGVRDADDLVCGVRLTDLDAAGDGRVSLHDAQFTADKQPSGRLRYEFNLPEVAPGRYEVRVAFSVKDSGDEPTVAEGRFQVRPPPGYVPPPSEEEDRPAPPLAFPAREGADPPPEGLAALTPIAPPPTDGDEDEDDMATVVMAKRWADRERDTDPNEEEDDGASGGEIHPFPKPLAPTSPGTAVEPTPPPPPAREPSPPRPVPLPLAAVPTPPPTEPSEAGSDVGAGAAHGTDGGFGFGTDGGFFDGAPEATAPAAAPPPPPPVLMPTPVLRPNPTHAEAYPAPDARLDTSHEDDALPDTPGESLDGTPPSPLDGLRDRLLEVARPDSPAFVATAVALCFLLIVFTLALARAC